MLYFVTCLVNIHKETPIEERKSLYLIVCRCSKHDRLRCTQTPN